MMPNITKGDRMSGLLSYLADTDPERTHNVHTEPHLVTGDSAIMAWHDDTELSMQDAFAIARQIDQPRRAFGVEVAGGSVWHCSLSLRAEEGELSDEKWAAIAQDFMDAMDFTDAGGKAPARWVAVRHGLSRNGNDHIHIAASRVREDGTKVSVHMDQPRAQRTARMLEKKYGLELLESDRAQRSTRGFKPAEREAAARRGQPEDARAALARQVRGCATASVDEAEFVRRLRRAGVLVRPRYASDRTDVVTGYSVALRPSKSDGADARPIWYGGGRLGHDLTLPALRQTWPDSPEGASLAVDEWNAAKRHRRPAHPGRERAEVTPEMWEKYTAEVTELRERLRSVPLDDRATWAHVARETAGAFAAWSQRVEPTPGPLAATADALARSAQLRRNPVRAERAGMPSASGAAMLLMSAAQGGQGTLAQAVLLRQLANTAKALFDMHKAIGEARRADEISNAIRGRLAEVAARMPAPTTPTVQPGEAVRVAQAGQVPLRAPGPVLPSQLPTTPAPKPTKNPAASPRHDGPKR